MTNSIRLMGATMVVVTGLSGSVASQGLVGHALALEAYRNALSYLSAALEQSNTATASEALVTAIAVDRSLSNALDRDRVRLEAASRRVDLGDAALLALLAEAKLERATQALFAGSWIATGNAGNRTLALESVQPALDKTTAAIAALTPLLQKIQGMKLPPALLLDVAPTRDLSGVFVLLVTISNVGDEAAAALELTLRKGESIGAGTETVTLGSMPPGTVARHVFAVAVPASATAATAQVEAKASNATTEVFAMDLDLSTP